METQRHGSPGRAILVAFGIAVFAFVVSNVLVTPIAFLEPAAADPEATPSLFGFVGLMILNFAGFFLAGAIYLVYTGRGWSYVDLAVPGKRGWIWAIGATVGSILFIIAFGILIQILGLPSAPNDVVNLVGDDRTLLIAMVFVVVFANAPAEEFLFRNVIQKRLAETFPVGAAVVLASVVFAAVHFPVFLVGDGSLLATFVSLSAVFVGSLIFGYAYAKTENLVVPTIAHAGFNIFQFGLLYLQLEYGDPEDLEELQSVVFETLGAIPV